MKDRIEQTPRVPLEIDPAAGRRQPRDAADALVPADAEAAVPRFRDLDEHECRALLARNHVGRLAYTFRDRVSIEPVHYVLDGDWLYGRTSPSEKLEVLRHSRWVAFEADEIDGLFEWRSVVAHGAFYTLDPDGPPDEVEARSRAIEMLRQIVPGTGTAGDPVPHRNVLFRIHLDRLEGRRATTGVDVEREVPLE